MGGKRHQLLQTTLSALLLGLLLPAVFIFRYMLNSRQRVLHVLYGYIYELEDELEASRADPHSPCTNGGGPWQETKMTTCFIWGAVNFSTTQSTFQNVLSITHREGEIPLLLVRLAPVWKLQQVGLRQVGHQVGLRQTQAFPVET